MKTMNPDLFPETLLIEHEGDRIFTTSLKVAEHSGKRHSEVLRAIENKLEDIPEQFRQRNFASATYLDRQKKPRVMYELTEEAFALTMMGFTGKEALVWQVGFIEAFVDMRAQLSAFKEREANALYNLRPKWRAIVQHPELKRQQLIGLTGHKSAGSITACRRRMRDVGLFD